MENTSSQLKQSCSLHCPEVFGMDVKKEKKKGGVVIVSVSKTGRISVTSVDPGCNVCMDMATKIVTPHLAEFEMFWKPQSLAK